MGTNVKNKTGHYKQFPWHGQNLKLHVHTPSLHPVSWAMPLPELQESMSREAVLLFPHPSLYAQMQPVQAELSIFDDKTASASKSHRTCSLPYRDMCVWQCRGRCSLQRKEKTNPTSALVEISHHCSEEGRNTWQAGWWKTPRMSFTFSPSTMLSPS